MTDYDWKKFEKRITLNSLKPVVIYNAWATRDGIESWFLRESIYTKENGQERGRTEPFEKGDQYRWLWHGYPDDTFEKGQILEANGKDHFQFTFSGGCIVTVSVIKEQNENICSLVQEMPMTDISEQRYFYIECGKGWTFYLANLKAVLQGGVDLRNKNVLIQKVVNA